LKSLAKVSRALAFVLNLHFKKKNSKSLILPSVKIHPKELWSYFCFCSRLCNYDCWSGLHSWKPIYPTQRRTLQHIYFATVQSLNF
jgi:hypothetical protein